MAHGAILGQQYANQTLSNLSNIQTALANLGAGVRPNLLDNAYFVGGGSQQGEEQLPINQMGATSWSAVGSVFDRWKIIRQAGSAKAMSVSLQSSGCLLSFPSTDVVNGLAFVQKNYITAGITCSASFLCELVSGNVYARLRFSNSTGSYVGQLIFPQVKNGINYTSGIVPDGTEFVEFQITNGDTQSSSVLLQAAKLEEGEGQTLAYKDSTGAWKLLPQPDMDYGTQLEECQRYFFPLYSESVFLGRTHVGSDTGGVFFVPTSVPMRVAPVFRNSQLNQYTARGNGASKSITSISIEGLAPGGVLCTFSVPSGIGVNQPVVITKLTSTDALSAEL